MSEIVVKVGAARREWRRQILAGAVPNILLPAAIRKEHLVLSREVLVNTKSGLCDYVGGRSRRVEEVLLQTGNPVGGKASEIRRRKIAKHLLCHGADVGNLVACKRQSASFPTDHLRGRRV